LIPENAGRIVRLEVASHIAASISNKNRRIISRKKLVALFNSGPLASIEFVKDEDPHEFAFTDSVAFIGGPYTVLPGIEDDSVYILQNLLNAIFRHRRQLPDRDYLSQCFDLTATVLYLSDQISSRAGLRRGLDPRNSFREPVIIPKLKDLDSLKNAVVFDRKHLDGFLLRRAIDPSVLDSLVTGLGELDLESYRLHESPLLERPIVKTEDWYIVALPTRLLTALRHALVNLTIEAGLTDDVVSRYTRSLWDTILEAMHCLKLDWVDEDQEDLPAVPTLKGGVFKLDTDKALCLVLGTDALVDYDPAKAFGVWNLGTLQEQIENTFDSMLARLLALPTPPNDILFCEIIQGVGRSYAVEIGRLKSFPFLYMTAADLLTLGHLEAGDPLVLWKYAHASERASEVAEITRLNELDEFHLYRTNRHSYYLSDEEKYNSIAIMPGHAGLLREELRHSRDWHWVRSFREGKAIDLTEVTLLFSDSKIPIYVTKPSVYAGAVEVLVEGLVLPIWITNVPFQSKSEFAARGTYARIAETMGYWIWQVGPSINDGLRSIDPRKGRILIEVCLKELEEWNKTGAIKDGQSAVLVSTDLEKAAIRIDLAAKMSRMLLTADNVGEREMVRQLLASFRDLLPPKSQSVMSQQVIEVIVDRHAPVGVKKKLLFFDSTAVPEIVSDGLPDYRALQEADENLLLDELGEHLTQKEGMQTGPISNANRTIVLQKAVAFFYKELRALASTLNPKGLLEWLVAHHEAAIRHTVFHAITIPTRLACFGTEPEMIEQLEKESPRDNLTAIANRFIIEFVVAQPPKGLRPISLSVYDRLQALASRIIDYGAESDLLHFNLSDYPLEILPSGRLGADRTTYDKAHALYAPTVMFGDIRRSSSSFETLWTDDPAPNKEAARRWAKLDEAAIAEFGFSMGDLRKFVSTAKQIGQTISPVVARLSKVDFVSQFSGSLEWSEERVLRTLSLLSSTPRASFLEPGGNYRREDTYPWRYNRALSYLRRPLLIRGSGTDDQIEVLWGIRHLHGFWKNMIALCTEGRLKAQTEIMRKVIGEFNRARGDRFNVKVANLFNETPGLIVRSKVKKIGSLRMSDEQGDLGDIDVLVADKTLKQLLVIECKDLALARTSFEMSCELTTLFKGTRHKKSILEAHQRKIRWVSRNLEQVLTWLDLNTEEWKVQPLIVVDREMFTPYLKQSTIPIVPIEKLRDDLSRR
jgi:hypothetical protein